MSRPLHGQPGEDDDAAIGARIAPDMEDRTAYNGNVPVLKSSAEALHEQSSGHLTITSAHSYFQCPPLPSK